MGAYRSASQGEEDDEGLGARPAHGGGIRVVVDPVVCCRTQRRGERERTRQQRVGSSPAHRRGRRREVEHEACLPDATFEGRAGRKRVLLVGG